MPSNVVKSKRDERLWQKAKKQAKKQGKAGEYDYIMGIYQKMKGHDKKGSLRGSALFKVATDRLEGGLADKNNPEDFSKEQLQKGIKVEMEHTNDSDIAREIAMDHLKEDPKYYDKLEKIERH